MIFKKKLVYFLLLLLFNCNSNNNFTISKVSENNSEYPDSTYEFPILNGNIEITEKINRHLIQDFLDLNYNTKHKSIFQNVWATKENPMPRLSFLEYKINLLNKKTYSLTFYSEGCGAYCEEFYSSYNYDLSNGIQIILDSIFTKKGKKDLLKIISNLKRTKIENHILNLKKEIGEDKEIIKQANLLYNDCLQSLPFEDLNYIDFKIKKDSIILESDRCSNHAMRALDNLGDYQFSFHNSEIEPFLNNYGYNILIENK